MTMTRGLNGRCALVAGGMSEIAAACVQRLGQEGMTVGFTGSDRQRGTAIAQSTGATFLHCDLSDRASTDRAIENALQLTNGRLDVLVTTPHVVPAGPIEATPEADFRRVVEVNLTSVFRMARTCCATMQAGGGSMVHITSASGIRAAHEAAVQSVTSAGVIALAELLAAEGAPHGIRSNAVCPGGLRGPTSAAGPSVSATDVASLVVWLAGEESAHMSGATLRLDGGAGAAMLLDTRG